MFEDFDKWLDVSRNFNSFLGVTGAIGLLSMLVYTFFLSKIGKKDEYSIQIRLNVTNKMFTTLMILFIAFFLFVPSEFIHYKQLIAAFASTTLLVGAITSLYYYFRDFIK